MGVYVPVFRGRGSDWKGQNVRADFKSDARAVGPASPKYRTASESVTDSRTRHPTLDKTRSSLTIPSGSKVCPSISSLPLGYFRITS